MAPSGHLQAVALYAVNAGPLKQEVCELRWDWLREVDGKPVVLIPGGFTKKEDERVVVLNSIASRMIEVQRGKHAEHVFVRGKKNPTPHGWRDNQHCLASRMDCRRPAGRGLDAWTA
ncbi:MAG: hypothetical protein KDI22_08515 [Gammaproteobacteria bacterium]|nr:hypothetical protein [Gammaproteobacteria bacterium]MCB1817223.1 hypothetical protein [Gammaproteobacteria bacterium]MCW5586650.1 hypothetical protein [Chromatiales bacterium]HOP16561.1 hypothetical protein [Gammaproteobacteria bacterium]